MTITFGGFGTVSLIEPAHLSVVSFCIWADYNFYNGFLFTEKNNYHPIAYIRSRNEISHFYSLVVIRATFLSSSPV